MMKRKKPVRLWWILLPFASLFLWYQPTLPMPVEVTSKVVGIGGWAFIGLGFFAVALTALWGPRGRERRPSLWPFRPQALFCLPVKHKHKK